jgi:hypothetical protein
MKQDALIDVPTPLGFRVRVTQARWDLIVKAKHPVMENRIHAVEKAMISPDEVRRSRTDDNVLLFYRTERAGP